MPGTETWWRAVATVREAVYATREGASPGEAETVNWTGLLINSTYAPQARRRYCEEWRAFSAFSLVFAFARRRRTASRFHPTPCGMNVKRGSKPTAEPTKNQRKTQKHTRTDYTSPRISRRVETLYVVDRAGRKFQARISRRVETDVNVSTHIAERVFAVGQNLKKG